MEHSMNIEQAKTIPICEFLDKLNIKPIKVRGHRATYLSPVRLEKTPSFDVDTQKNLWIDRGTGIGGDIVSLAQKYLEYIGEACTISDALRFIENIGGFALRIVPIELLEEKATDPTLSINDITKITHPALIRYQESRGISLTLAQRYLKEVKVYNKKSGKHFFALGFINDSGGYELRNEHFKGCIGIKDMTFIRGEDPESKGIHIIEGRDDFLSILENRKLKRLKEDAIVLNSLSILTKATPFIKNYRYRVVYTWMDNDTAGLNATKSIDDFVKIEQALRHRPMNDVYLKFKDVNAWYMHTLGL